jgi:tRNA pseudouridine55 synthase
VPLTGIINVDKPAGPTSHDVVAAVRRMAGQQKVGHAGTLDPIATGVLLICLGAATRVVEYLVSGRKRYRATIVLGATTDTYDAAGRWVSQGGRADFSRSEIESALVPFLGRIEQAPPAYSAVKHQGQPLYRRARRGEAVVPSSRVVEVDALAVLDWTPPALILDIACSPGTYIRSLAHDLGQRLGSGAYVASLVRLSSGCFALEEAVSLERLEEAFRNGQEGLYLLPADEALLDWPALVLGNDDSQRIRQGLPVRGAGPSSAETAQSLCRAYSSDGEFLGILAYQATTRCWRPHKVFAGQDTGQ